MRLKNGSRTRLNQQSMARSHKNRRSRRLEDGEKRAEGKKVGKISSSLKQENCEEVQIKGRTKADAAEQRETDKKGACDVCFAT